MSRARAALGLGHLTVRYPARAPEMWCAVTPTVHFSATVVFFQSTSLSRVALTPVPRRRDR
jgi:hypothetical protein